MHDLSMAVESLEDEIEGINKYKEYIESAECQELKKIFYENMQAEKIHVNNLLKWINAKAHKSLS